MTTYVKLVDYASKDALASGNPSKLVKGAELGPEFDAIAAADATSVKNTGNQSVAGVKTFSDTTDASSSTVGGTIVSGGLAVAKKIYVGTDLNVGGHITTEGVTATGATGTGKLVFDTSPTLVTPALGTPASGTLTSCTGLPISTGVSGLGTGVATALAVNVGTAGAPVVNGGALGTPSSGTVTNLTGTASININGTVGATTPTTGAFTTLNTSDAITSSKSVNSVFVADTLTNANTGTAAAVRYSMANSASHNLNITLYGGSYTTGTIDIQDSVLFYTNGAGGMNFSSAASFGFYAGGGTTKHVDISTTALAVTGAITATTTGKVGTTLGVGNTTPSASGAGITFPAVQSASTDANTLDDYEEGTWTPTIVGTGTAGTGTYSAQTGYYEKIGRAFLYDLDVSWTAHTGTGNIRIGGFPFTSSTICQNSYAADSLTLTANNYCSLLQINNATTTADIYQSPVGGGTLTAVALDTSARILSGGKVRAS